MKYNGIYYELTRKKMPFLVFIHGAGSNHTVWKKVQRALSAWSTLVVDLRGHGHSSRGDVSFDAYAKDVVKVLDHEKISNAVFIGNSTGATIAYHIYKKWPDRVKKMVLITPFARGLIRFQIFLKLVYSVMYWIVKPFHSNRKLTFQDYHKYENRPLWYYPLLDIRGTSLTTYFKSIKDVFSYSLLLEKIDKPCLILLAQHDLWSKNLEMEMIGQQKSNVVVRIIKSHHAVLTRRPETVAQYIERFI